MDLGEGLPKGLGIEFGPHARCQRLGYIHVPFHCSECNVYGHLKKSCLEKEEGAKLNDSHIMLSQVDYRNETLIGIDPNCLGMGKIDSVNKPT
jgi:hypothetical protein